MYPLDYKKKTSECNQYHQNAQNTKIMMVGLETERYLPAKFMGILKVEYLADPEFDICPCRALFLTL